MIGSIFNKVLLPLAAVGLLAFAVMHVAAQKPESQAPPSAEPTHSPFPNTVAASGLIEAAAENVAVGSPVAGVVVEVFAKVGQKVAPGTPLFRLDDRVLRADLNFRKAAVASAQADLTRLEHLPRPESLAMCKSQLDDAQANMLDMQDQFNRTSALVERKVSTEQELVTRRQAFHMARAKFMKAQSEFDMTKAGAWEYELQVSRAALAQAQAQQQQVETDLERLTVCGLAAGEVLQVDIRPGEFVAAPSNRALVLVGDVEQLHVRVDIDEHDIPRFRPGARAKAMLKGHASQEFAMQFVRVEPYVIPKKSLTGENTERVDTRVLPVIYAIEPEAIRSNGQRLYVGQQVDAYIDAGEADPAHNLAGD